jgi:hypothetical protein
MVVFVFSAIFSAAGDGKRDAIVPFVRSAATFRVAERN